MAVAGGVLVVLEAGEDYLSGVIAIGTVTVFEVREPIEGMLVQVVCIKQYIFSTACISRQARSLAERVVIVVRELDRVPVKEVEGSRERELRFE